MCYGRREGIKMTITIAHTKGGVGKSIIAWNLAYAMQKRKERVVIVDLDFQQTLFFASEIRKQHKKEEITKSTITVLQPQTPEEFISIINSSDYAECEIIVDVGGFDNDINRTAITHADIIVVPVSTDTTEIIGLQTFEAILKELDTVPISLLLNNIHHATKNFTDIKALVESIENAKLLKTIIRSSKAFDRTIAKGTSIVEGDNTKPKEQIESLYKEIEKLKE